MLFTNAIKGAPGNAAENKVIYPYCVASWVVALMLSSCSSHSTII